MKTDDALTVLQNPELEDKSEGSDDGLNEEESEDSEQERLREQE